MTDIQTLVAQLLLTNNVLQEQAAAQLLEQRRRIAELKAENASVIEGSLTLMQIVRDKANAAAPVAPALPTDKQIEATIWHLKGSHEDFAMARRLIRRIYEAEMPPADSRTF